LVFTDTIRAAYRQLFTNSNKGADLIVSGRQDVASASSAPATIPLTLVRKIRRLPGVRAARGQISDVATIVGRGGKVIKSSSSPTLALTYLPPPFSGVRFLAGRPPRGPNEVALDQATALRQGYHIGSRVPIVTGEPMRRFKVTGIASLGSASLGGATFVVFDLVSARRLYGKEGKVDLIYVAAASGTSSNKLATEIRPLLPSELVVRTPQGQVDTDVSRVSSQLGILTGGLLAFGLIAVVVGAFVIFNTFSFTVTQRLREFALLRALGATRAQVLATVLAEAAVVGALASIGGILVGLLAAQALHALFSAVGFELPTAALVLSARTVIVSLGVGIAMTVFAGLSPALRATKPTPIEALRESTASSAALASRPRVRALVALSIGVVGLVAILVSSGSAGQRVAQSAVGALACVVAIVILSPLLIRRLASMLVVHTGRDRGIVARLAQENAARNPTRTAVSASALMIGLALVLFVTVYASGLRTSSTQIIHQTFLGDFAVESQDGVTPIPAASSRVAATVPGVIGVSGLKSAEAQLAGNRISAQGIDPNSFEQVYRFNWDQGSDGTLGDLRPGDVLLERDTANSTHLKVGQSAVLQTETGVRSTVTVRGIYNDKAMLRGAALSLVQFNQLFHQPRLQAVFLKLGPDADRAASATALNQALGSFPGVVARSEHQLEDEISGRVNSILVLFYALLAMSVLLALLGIVNTLNLSIYERTRELGLLRAIGMTSRQARRLIRQESVITATIGSVV
ncbi:MAG: FtsX-like permease family protein, partial [Solirubrobacterales bacterium]|nr:FtsX-like permease family protein [Solirubrobacterales bacterium]